MVGGPMYPMALDSVLGESNVEEAPMRLDRWNLIS